MSSGYAFKMSDYCDEGVGLINGESIQHGIINDDNLNHLPESFVQHYPEFLLKENDIVVGLNRPITNGNLKIARIPSKYNDSLLYQRAGKIVYKTDCDKDFTYVLLSQEILKHTLVEAVGSDQPFISTSKLDGWKMMMPSDMEEQVKIGEYFQNLDHLITLHQRKGLAGEHLGAPPYGYLRNPDDNTRSPLVYSMCRARLCVRLHFLIDCFFS